MKIMGPKLSSLVLFTAGAVAATASQAATFYTFADLGTETTQSYARAINDTGKIAGYALFPDETAYDAVSWDGTKVTGLGTLGGSFSSALGINSAGQIVGYSETANHRQHATLWNDTTATDLQPQRPEHGEAQAINDAGQVAGAVFTSATGRQATVWNGTTPTDLGSLGGQSSQARAINNAGQVAGDSYLEDDTTKRATVWNGTKATDLGTLGGRSSIANDINNNSELAGYAYLSGDSAYHATLWNGTSATDLGTLGGNLSEARALNDAGLAVGWAQTSSGVTHATLWDNTTAIDLNSFLDASTAQAGWVLERAYDINSTGWIVGDAHNAISGANHAFLLTPVPEPETYALFMAGLALMATVMSARPSTRIKTS
ncbi:putative secreted protein with PEP-CTERM sorting signal [Nitrosospira sp. Nsp2]|uniref:PEP-CTERM sorting domain-containing protein n=1 Tax=Nitrosospira sp. Nsp2 TaxID=136548 RepID=UPI000D30D9C7|nr:PEP-CTERM sorting domain-containing protein [Nitrosospira sp. Nsp2]PTR16129.1 putative secreted protein with PEP-CTERM sorting signal [Nitrosospira sp. Nsp2]